MDEISNQEELLIFVRNFFKHDPLTESSEPKHLIYTSKVLNCSCMCSWLLYSRSKLQWKIISKVCLLAWIGNYVKSRFRLFVTESLADFVMIQFDAQNQPNPIMLGQCHLYLGNVNSDVNKTILISFLKNPSCRLFLVVASAFTNIQTFSSEEYFVWRFVRDSDGMLTQVPLNDSQKATASKHVLLLELYVLYSGKESKRYLDDTMDIFYRVLRLRAYGFLGS